MDAWVWIVIAVVVVAVIAIVAIVVWQQRRRKELRESFGAEYERAVAREGDVRKGESELMARRERRAEFDIRPLSPQSRTAYARSWDETQARFVDDPATALAQADSLIIAVMGERGYPMDDFDRRAEDISVDHPDVVQHYRAAHDISVRLDQEPNASADSTNSVSTEDLRQGLVHYRALFQELLETDEDEPARDRATG
ncbi:MAG TPA: hypothetical protein VFM40_09015 [Actinomycetota bacterium]|nr:hypothetical protein [Actinomycetota bacterium]